MRCRLRKRFLRCTAAPARSWRGPAWSRPVQGGARRGWGLGARAHAVAGASSLADAVLACPGLQPGKILRPQSRSSAAAGSTSAGCTPPASTSRRIASPAMRRRRLAQADRAEDRERLDRDGFVVKRDFLPPELFADLVAQVRALRAPAREMVEGDTVTRHIALDPAVLARVPAARALLDAAAIPQPDPLCRILGGGADGLYPDHAQPRGRRRRPIRSATCTPTPFTRPSRRGCS